MLLSRELICMDSPRFLEVSEAVLSSGSKLRFHARGLSMQPNILDGDLVVVAPVQFSDLRRGQVVLSDSDKGLKLHRIISIENSQRLITTRGDASNQADLPVSKVLGKVVEIQRAGKTLSFTGELSHFRQTSNRLLRRLQLASSLRLRKLASASIPAGRTLQSATAGIVAALVIQGICYFLDQSATRGRLEDHIFVNWISLLLAPFSFLSRMNNPDGPLAVSLYALPFMLLANGGFYVACYRSAELIFKRIIQKAEREEVSIMQSDSTSADPTL